MGTPDQFPQLYDTFVPATTPIIDDSVAPGAPAFSADTTTTSPVETTFRPIAVQDDNATTAANLDPAREELSNMWLAHRSFGIGAHPENVEQLHTIEGKAKALGLTLDDVISDAESKESFSDRWASKLYRNGGPIYRGVVNSVDSTKDFITNAAYRSLSNIPGWEGLSTKADEANRNADVTNEISDRLNREGSLASLITPTGASILGSVSQSVADLAEITAGTTAAAALLPEAAVAGGIGAAASKVITPFRALAVYFGLREAEKEITVAKDKGLSPGMVAAHSIAMGGQTAFFTLFFGKLAENLGIATAEQAMLPGRPAVDNLIKYTKLGETLAGIGMSAGEQASIAAGHMYWKSIDGTGTLDDGLPLILQAAAIGGVTRGASEFVSPVMKRFQVALTRTQEAMPDWTRGTIEVTKAHEEGREVTIPANASDTYKAAIAAETSRLATAHQTATDTLNSIRPDGSTIPQTEGSPQVTSNEDSVGALLIRVKDLKERQANLAEQIANMPPQVDSTLQLVKKVSPLDNLNTQKAIVDAQLKDAIQAQSELSDMAKTAVKSTVYEKVATQHIKDTLDESNGRLERAQNSAADTFRTHYQLPELPEAQQITMEQSRRMAVEQGVPQKAVAVATDVITNLRPLSHVEQAGILVAIDATVTDAEYANAISKDMTRTKAERDTAGLMAAESIRKASFLTQGLRIGGEEAARTMAMRRYAVVDPLSPASIEATVIKFAKSPIAPEKMARFTDESITIHKAEQLRDSVGRPLNALEDSEMEAQAKAGKVNICP